MTERPEGTPEPSTDEEALPEDTAGTEPEASPPVAAAEPDVPTPAEPDAPPQAETETAAPEAPQAVEEELETQAGAFEAQTDDAAVDEIEAELEAEEATADELGEEEADEAADDEDDEFEPEPEPAAAGAAAGATGAAASAVARRRGAPTPAVQRAPTQSQIAVHVTDNPSRLFVIASVLVFVVILAYGLLAGNGGLLTATPAPPTAAPSVSAEPSASSSVAPSESTEASASPS